MEIFEKIKNLSDFNYKKAYLDINLRYLECILTDKTYLNLITICKKYLETFSLDFNILYSLGYTYIELDLLDSAKQLLENINKYKKYFKKNNKNFYLKHCFLEAYLKYKKNDKLFLEKFFSDTKLYQNLELFRVFIVFLEYLENNNNVDFEQNVLKIKYSFYKNILIFKSMKNGFVFKDRDLFYRVLKWANNRHAKLDTILIYYKKFMTENIIHDVEFYKSLYLEYKFEWIYDIVLKLIDGGNIKNESNLIFLKNNLISNKKSIEIYIKICYINDFYDIEIDILNQFFETTKDDFEDFEIKQFIYYILCRYEKYEKYEKLLRKYENNIVQFILYCLENNIQTTKVLNIYTFFLKIHKKYINLDKYVMQIKKYILDNIFKYNIVTTSEDIKYIWISEFETNKTKLYFIEKDFFEISLISNNFEYFCFDKTNKNYIHKKIYFEEKIKNLDEEILSYLHEYDPNDFKLKIAIAKHLVEFYDNQKIESKILNTTQKQISLLLLLLNHKDISHAFRQNIYLTLANIYFLKNNYNESYNFYRKLDYMFFDYKYYDNYLLSCIKISKNEAVLNILMRASKYISDPVLFKIIKFCISQNLFVSNLGDLCYRLILNSWYDKQILDIVIKYCNYTIEQWYLLCKYLDSMFIVDFRVHEIILKNSMLCKIFNETTQSIFNKVYKSDFDRYILRDYIYFTIYNVLKKNVLLQEDTLENLSDYYLKNKKDFLACYAISFHHENMNINQNILKDAIFDMQINRRLLPQIKCIKNNMIACAYITKNHSFIFEYQPNKVIFFCYKFLNQSKYEKKQMQYLKFGIYVINIIIFFGDSVEYYFELDNHNLENKIQIFSDDKIIIEDQLLDRYFVINNCFKYKKLFKYDDIEKNIDFLLNNQINLDVKLL